MGERIGEGGKVSEKVDVGAAWKAAQGSWSKFLVISPPKFGPLEGGGVGRIHLGTRQVEVDLERLEGMGLGWCLEGLLAHELGHHVRYPGTMGVWARLRVLERGVLPFKGYSTLNMFTDLLINEALSEPYKEVFCALYRGLCHDIPADGCEKDAAFLFYLSVYEELWQRPEGELLPLSGLNLLTEQFPDYRADARLLTEHLFPLGPNIYTQFLYFASIIGHYVQPAQGMEEPEGLNPWDSGLGEPSDDDWADALTPTQREIDALNKALAEGWLRREVAERMMSPQEGLRGKIMGLPGAQTHQAERIPDIMAAYYRRQAERYLIKPPLVASLGEAVVPTDLEAWEVGDPIQSVDWAATFGQFGADLGMVSPLKRVRIADVEGYDAPFWQPKIEIYLDVSGSMPDPRAHFNAMTLASQILLMGAIQAGGWARALLYSVESVRYWEWCRSEIELSKFLMHYIGGGTAFPFEVLEESVIESREEQPIRAVITDRDFDANYLSNKENERIFGDAARRSQMVLLLHGANVDRVKVYKAANAQVVEIQDMEDFPKMAAKLSHALFGSR